MTYLVAAYVVAILLIGAYVVYLARRLAVLSEDLDDLRRRPER